MEQNQNNCRKWYVVLTKARSEESARLHLTHKGIEVFYPQLSLPVSNQNGRHAISLFPNYLFVRIDASSSEYYQVVWCSGVKKLVNFGGAPSAIDESIVNFLQERADSNGLLIARSSLKVGDEVKISKGPFQGLAGIIEKPPDNNRRVKVLMALLSRSVSVEVPTGYITMGWIAHSPIVAV